MASEGRITDPIPDNPILFAMFDRYRDYVKHEDNLINQRSTWNVTIQSFLVAVFGFTVQKILESVSHISLNELDAYRSIIYTYVGVCGIICVAGLLANYLTIKSVSAAGKAILNLEERWSEVSNREKNPGLDCLVFITGGNLIDPYSEPHRIEGIRSPNSKDINMVKNMEYSKPSIYGRMVPIYIPVTLMLFWGLALLSIAAISIFLPAATQ